MPTALPTSGPVNASMLTTSAIALAAALLIDFFVTHFALSLLIAYLPMAFCYVASVLVGLFPVIAFVFVGLVGFMLSSRLRQTGIAGNWAQFIGVGASIGAFAWIIEAFNNGYFFSFVTQMLWFDYRLVSMISNALRIVWALLALAAAVFFFLAAIQTKKSLAVSNTAGAIAAILLGVYALGSILYTFVIASLIGSLMYNLGAGFDLIPAVFRFLSTLLFLPLLGFSIFQTVFSMGIVKQLRRY